MRTYEALYIASPELDDDAIHTIAKEVENLVTGNGGAIVRSDIWGRRKMAYTVKKQTEGAYILLRFQCAPGFVQKVETYFKLNEKILRYLIVHFDERTLRLEEEQLRRREEEIRASNAARDRDDDDDEDDFRGPRFRGRDRDEEDEDDEGAARAGARRGRRRPSDEDED